MNKLTLIGYLKKYFNNERNLKTLSVRKLSDECLKNNIEMEYVALYAVLMGKEYLCAKNVSLYKECIKIMEAKNVREVSDKYNKIYEDYEKKNIENQDDEFKQKIRNRILEIQSDKNISNYRIYTDLALNPGNVNSFLKNGNDKKLSLDVIRRIWKYVERI